MQALAAPAASRTQPTSGLACSRCCPRRRLPSSCSVRRCAGGLLRPERSTVSSWWPAGFTPQPRGSPAGAWITMPRGKQPLMKSGRPARRQQVLASLQHHRAWLAQLECVPRLCPCDHWPHAAAVWLQSRAAASLGPLATPRSTSRMWAGGPAPFRTCQAISFVKPWCARVHRRSLPPWGPRCLPCRFFDAAVQQGRIVLVGQHAFDAVRINPISGRDLANFMVRPRWPGCTKQSVHAAGAFC